MFKSEIDVKGSGGEDVGTVWVSTSYGGIELKVSTGSYTSANVKLTPKQARMVARAVLSAIDDCSK